jgi:hypothetical protein
MSSGRWNLGTREFNSAATTLQGLRQLDGAQTGIGTVFK